MCYNSDMKTSIEIVADILFPTISKRINMAIGSNYTASLGADVEIDMDTIRDAITFDIDEIYGDYRAYWEDNLINIETLINRRLPTGWYVEMPHIPMDSFYVWIGHV